MAQSGVYSTLTKIGYPIFGSKISSIKGLEHVPTSGNFIIAANHVDWLDGFFIATAVGQAKRKPVYFLAKSKTYWWTTAILPMPKNKKDSVDVAIDYVRRGKTLVIFPEGERNSSSKLRPGKTGAVRIAVGAGVPIVPLGLTCSTGRNVGQSLVNLMSKHHYVQVEIGKPLTFNIPPGGISHEWLHDQTRRLMRAIAPLSHKSV